jgi:hypothetical protein
MEWDGCIATIVLCKTACNSPKIDGCLILAPIILPHYSMDYASCGFGGTISTICNRNFIKEFLLLEMIQILDTL